MKRFLFPVLAVAAVLLTFAGVAFAAQTDTVRFSGNMHNAFLMTNGSPVHRATLTPDNSTAESNLTAAGGTAVTYTFFGGERVCVQALTTDTFIEIIAAASVTAAGAKGFTVAAGGALTANCFTLQPGELSVSALCTGAGPCLVKLFELR